MRSSTQLVSHCRCAPLLAATVALALLSAPTGAAGAADQAACEARLARPDPSPPDRDAATFALQFGAEVSPYRLTSAFVMPGESLEIEAVLADAARRDFVACAERGALRQTEDAAWSWRAPREPGHSDLLFIDRNSGARSRLRVFVLRPYRGERSLDGYRIGSYERTSFRGLDAYRFPTGLLQVDAADVDIQVSPHFQLGQFLCKQADSFPKVLLLSTRLLLKLERLLEEVRAAGIPASSFVIMSAYRTPFYNRQIGNTTKYSRHLYGDAADLYIDEDGDGNLDDLDGDGRVTFADAKKLADLFERAGEAAWYRPFVGGLGIYGPASHRGPFVHVDTRGYRARWSHGGP